MEARGAWGSIALSNTRYTASEIFGYQLANEKMGKDIWIVNAEEPLALSIAIALGLTMFAGEWNQKASMSD